MTNSKSINTSSNNGFHVGISQKVVDQVQDLRYSSEIGKIEITKAASRVQPEIHGQVRRLPVNEFEEVSEAIIERENAALLVLKVAGNLSIFCLGVRSDCHKVVAELLTASPYIAWDSPPIVRSAI